MTQGNLHNTAPTHSPLLNLLLRQLSAQPEAPAFIFADQDNSDTTLTYAALDAAATRVAAALLEASPAAKCAVAFSSPGTTLLTSVFGSLYAGMSTLVLPDSARQQHAACVSKLVERFEPDICVGSAASQRKWTSLVNSTPALCRLPWLSSDAISGKSLRLATTALPARDEALIASIDYSAYGEPKLCTTSHADVADGASALCEALAATKEDIALAWDSPFSQSSLIWSIWLPLCAGCPSVILREDKVLAKPLSWIESVSRHRATISGATELGLDLCSRHLSDVASWDLSAWEVAYACGELPLSVATARRFFTPLGRLGLAPNAPTASFTPRSWHCPVAVTRRNQALKVLCRTATDAVEPPHVLEFDTSSDWHRSDDSGLYVEGGEILGAYQLTVQPGDASTGSHADTEIWVSEQPQRRDPQSGSSLTGGTSAAAPTGYAGCLCDRTVFVTSGPSEISTEAGRVDVHRAEMVVEHSHERLRFRSGAVFSVNEFGLKRIVVVQEVERRRSQPSSDRRASSDRRGKNQPETPPASNTRRSRASRRPDLHAPSRHKLSTEYDADTICRSIREALLGELGLDSTDILLVRPNSLARSPNGAVLGVACRRRFLARELHSIGEWNAPLVDPKLLERGTRSQLERSMGAVIERIVSRFRGSSNERPDPSRPLMERGLASIDVPVLDAELQRLLGSELCQRTPLPTALVFSHPSTLALAEFLAESVLADRRETGRPAPAPVELEPTPRANSTAIAESPNGHTPIAIVGAACRLPGLASTPEAFWNLLSHQSTAARETPADRWDVDAYHDPVPGAPGKLYARWGGFCETVNSFDAAFFEISNAEARAMDPQQRMLLEVSWEALERANHPAERFARCRTGVFVGLVGRDHAATVRYRQQHECIGVHSLTGLSAGVASGRISYLLGLTGPSLTIDTACSSSLVSLHLACQSIRRGECDSALAGGVNLLLSPEDTIALCQMNALTPSNGSVPFDADADGFTRADGCVMLVLRPLDVALAENDNVLAIIRGSAINQDGKTPALTAPNGRAQQSVVREALRAAGTTAAEAELIEAHGTGTILGDPVEIGAMSDVLGDERTRREKRCAIGAVKGNIGHTEAVAGIASVLKTVLSLQNETIAPHPKLARLNPHIQYERSPVVFPSAVTGWVNARTRIGSVSSFGFSGTNAHVVLQQSPQQRQPRAIAGTTAPQVLAISAKTGSALTRLCRRYSSFFARNPDVDLADACTHACLGRTHFAHRLAFVARDSGEAQRKLAAYLAEATSDDDRHSVQKPAALSIVFGGERNTVLRNHESFGTQPAYRLALQQCTEILEPLLGATPAEIALHGPRSPAEAWQIDPASAAIEYSLAQLWLQWGMEPQCVFGFGSGELVAACFVDIFPLDAGLRLIARRAELLAQVEQAGFMAAIELPQLAMAALRSSDKVDILAIMSSHTCVAMADTETELLAELRRIGSREQYVRLPLLALPRLSRIPCSVLDEIEALAQDCVASPPTTTFVSGLSGKTEDSELLRPSYWRKQVRSTIRVDEAMRTLASRGISGCLQLGVNDVLAEAGQRVFDTWLTSPECGQYPTTLEVLATLYMHGASVKWLAVYDGVTRGDTVVPTYPFKKNIHQPAPQPSEPPRKTPSPKRSHLGELLPLPYLDRLIFETRVDPQPYPMPRNLDQPGLQEMRLGNVVAMAIAAADRLFGPEPTAIEKIELIQPLRASTEARLVHFVCSLASDFGSDFRVLSAPFDERSRKRSWTLHARGRMTTCKGIEVRGTRSTDLGQGGAQRLVGKQLQHALAATRTPRLATRSIVSATLQSGVFKVMLDQDGEPGAPTPDEWDLFLHSALLAEYCIRGEDSDICPPRVIRDLRCARSFAREGSNPVALIEVRSGEQAPDEYQIVLYDDVQQPLVAIGCVEATTGEQECVATDPLPPEEVRRPRCYELAWRPEPLQHQPASDSGTHLILTDAKNAMARELGSRFGDRPHFTVVNSCDGLPNPLTETCSAAIDSPEVVEHLIAKLSRADAPLSSVAFCFGTERFVPPEQVTSLAELGLDACRCLLCVVQALIAQQHASLPRLYIVTRGAQGNAAAKQPPSFNQTALWGMGRVVSLEAPGLRTTLIDLDPDADANSTWHDFERELLANSEERMVAWRGKQRLVARLTSVTQVQAEKAAMPVRPDGAYLVTGGLGALGTIATRWLIEHGATNVVLVGRTPPAPGQLAQIAEPSKARIHFERVDVAKSAEIAVLFQKLEYRYPPLRGIIHAAGSLEDRILSEQTWESFLKVVGPKAIGAFALHQATKNKSLDFFVLFSSVASLCGVPAQANYAAANAYMDGLAHFRRTQGLPAMSINWGPWARIGMAAALGEAGRERFARWGMRYLDPDNAMALFERSMARAASRPQLAIVDADWNRFASAFGTGEERWLAAFRPTKEHEELSQNPPSSGPRSLGARLANLPVNRALRLLRGELTELVKRTLGLDISCSVESDRPLAEFGLDSLLAVDLRNRCTMLTGLHLPATLVFDYPTIDKLGQFICSQLAKENKSGREPAKRPDPQTERTTLADMLREFESEADDS